MNVFTRKSCAKLFLSVIAAAAVFCPHVPALSAQDDKPADAAKTEASAQQGSRCPPISLCSTSCAMNPPFRNRCAVAPPLR